MALQKINESDQINLTRQILTLLGVLVILVCFTGIIDRDVWTPDEPRVVAMSLEMSRTGNYIVPKLSGQPFVEKPPLGYAATSVTIKYLSRLLGVTGAARLSIAFWGLGVLIFTGLLSREIFGKPLGMLSVCVLATMGGFVEHYHWIRIDAALSFFIIAAVWSLVRGFIANKPIHYLLTGLFTAGAFLCKGIIGPVLILIPLIGLCASRLFFSPRPLVSKKELPYLGIGLLLFLGLSGIWVYLFRINVDAATWHEWFWVNHLGRFTGQAVQKGHMKGHAPFYYLKTIALYSLPWTPFTIGWLIQAVKKRKLLSPKLKQNTLFLAIWGLGSCLLLSIPSTKRDIYLLPVLPVYALMATEFLSRNSSRWIRIHTWFYVYLSVFLLGVFSFVPLLITPFSSDIPLNIYTRLAIFDYRNTLCLVALIFCLGTAYKLKRYKSTPAIALFICSAALYWGILLVPFQVLNSDKSMKVPAEHFLNQISDQERASIAGWNFSQTTLGAFYLYGDWMVPQIHDQNRLNTIVAGRDKEYKGAILNQVESIPDLLAEPYVILLEAHPRGQRKRNFRGVYWIEGKSNLSKSKH